MENFRLIVQPRYLFVVTMAVLLLTSSSIVSAQKMPPHGFLGSATVNSSPAADGTVVAALVDGQQVTAKAVTDGSYPVLLVGLTDSYVGKTVTFTIGGIPAVETALWQQGEVTELNLTATPATELTSIGTSEPIPVMATGEKGDTGPAGPPGQQGVQGPAGPSGSGGPAGPAGSAGPAGVAGPQGTQGLTGPEGAAGTNGSSLTGILALVFAALAFIGTFGSMIWRRLVDY